MTDRPWTPGPWLAKFHRIGSQAEIHSTRQGSRAQSYVATIVGKADAHPIAAAPELYEALDELLRANDLHRPDCGCETAINLYCLACRAELTLAAARGEAQP